MDSQSSLYWGKCQPCSALGLPVPLKKQRFSLVLIQVGSTSHRNENPSHSFDFQDLWGPSGLFQRSNQYSRCLLSGIWSDLRMWEPSLPKSPAVLRERDWAASSKHLDQNPTQTPWVHSSRDCKDNRQTKTAAVLKMTKVHHNTCIYQHGKETDWGKPLTSPRFTSPGVSSFPSPQKDAPWRLLTSCLFWASTGTSHTAYWRLHIRCWFELVTRQYTPRGTLTLPSPRSSPINCFNTPLKFHLITTLTLWAQGRPSCRREDVLEMYRESQHEKLVINHTFTGSKLLQTVSKLWEDKKLIRQTEEL